MIGSNSAGGRELETGYVSADARDEPDFGPSELELKNPRWNFHWCGFHLGQSLPDVDWRYVVTMFAVPYWAVVLPPTLLSAYLLLVKPRPKKPPEST